MNWGYEIKYVSTIEINAMCSDSIWELMLNGMLDVVYGIHGEDIILSIGESSNNSIKTKYIVKESVIDILNYL